MCSQTYYTILECEESATLEEIKRNYQRLIKCTHPDKGEQVSSDYFIKINEAWQTLKDDNLRRQYDASLLHANINDCPMIYATVNVEDLDFVHSFGHYRCRCGQDIVIDEHHVNEEETIFECGECSNCIVVVNGR